ncbi:MAG: PIN domain-containing protein [Anaerolineae bacterium]|nr:PIN domain-containing protein [Anaerolineae bacterium]
MTSSVLIDSSFLYALYDYSDRRHELVERVARTRAGTFVIPNVVLTETTFLFSRSGGVPAVARFLHEFVNAEPRLQGVTIAVLQRARDIMIAYHDSRFDFVDCCLMALAEQLQITQIGTLDRRDFAIYRPTHCDYFDLLP